MDQIALNTGKGECSRIASSRCVPVGLVMREFRYSCGLAGVLGDISGMLSAQGDDNVGRGELRWRTSPWVR